MLVMYQILEAGSNAVPRPQQAAPLPCSRASAKAGFFLSAPHRPAAVPARGALAREFHLVVVFNTYNCHVGVHVQMLGNFDGHVVLCMFYCYVCCCMPTQPKMPHHKQKHTQTILIFMKY